MRRLLLLGVLLVLAGCTAARPRATRPMRVLHDVNILTDTVWQGAVRIDGFVKVAKGATLTIHPGTDISFVRRDADRDGLGDGTLRIEGRLLALGTRQAPIRFHSAAAHPQPGDWLAIRADFSSEVHLRYCVIRDSAYTLHAHFTRGVVEDCTIRDNIDGCRLGQADFVIRNCLVEDNQGKGLNFRNSTVTVTHNIIRRNDAGIFLFETQRPCAIHQNNLYANRYNFRLGDFFRGDVHLSGNWWGTADPDAAAATVYDHKRDPSIGTVTLQPVPDWIPHCGPRDALAFREAWQFATGGFVDAPVRVVDGQVFALSWDSHLYALDEQGTLLWSRSLEDVADAPPAYDGRRFYCQSWAREVFAFDRHDGTPLWRFSYAPSPADDHRQGGLLRTGKLLLVPAWNGTLYALDPQDGMVRWHFRSRLPLRAPPVRDGDRIYLASGGGLLSALRLDGTLLWNLDLGQPLLSSPAVTPAGPVVVTRAGVVYALDRSGAQRWQRDLQEECFYAAPVYGRGALYIATAGGSVWKLAAADGRVLWRFRAAASIYGTPLLRDGRLFFGDNGGTLYALGAESGDLLTSFQAPGEIQGTPRLVGHRLFFGARDHAVHALDLLPEQAAGD